MASKVTAGGGSEPPQEEPAAPQVPQVPQVPQQQSEAGRAPVTRQDLPVAARIEQRRPAAESARPESPAESESPPAAPPAPAPQSPPEPPEPPEPAPSPGARESPDSPASPPAASAPQTAARNWHRYHLVIGVFLLAYGGAGLLGTLIGWDGRQKEIAGYLGDTVGLGAGAATPALIGIKVVEALLTAIVLAGVLRRKDVWFLPSLTGWIAGFAVFCLLDLWAGRPGRLVEHAAFLIGFTVLLFVSYGLSVKVRVGGTTAPETGRPGGSAGPAGLSRTQEIALAALNRWQRGAP